MNTAEAIMRLRQVIRQQHKAISTEASYVYWLSHYMALLPRLDKSLSSEQKIEQFLTGLACNRNVSVSTQNQAFNAILVFYHAVLGQTIANVDALRAKRPAHMRHAPSVTETQALLQTVRNEGGYPTNLVR